MIPQSLLNNYRKEVDQAGNEASKYIQAVVDTYRSQYPNASVSEIRDYTRDAMRDVLYLYGGQSALLSNDFFEEVARQNGEDLSTEIYETIDYDQADKKIRYFAKSLVTGDIADFDHSISELTKYYVKRQAFENLVKNCDKHGLRYARVPSGRETCAFCFMLASRGFVYWSEEDAGGMGHKYHSHCDCVIVPGFHKSSGVNEDEQIEGYKPSKLYERYQMCYNTINPDGTWNGLYERWKNAETEDTWEQYKTHQLMAEINKRDTRWLWSGRNPAIDYSEKARDALTKNEKDAVDWLSRNGIRVKTKIEDPTAKKNIDFEICGKLYEHKNITNLSSVSNQLGRSRKKFYLLGINEMRHVFTLNDKTCSDEEILNKLRERIKDNEEILVVFKDGLIRIKK